MQSTYKANTKKIYLYKQANWNIHERLSTANTHKQRNTTFFSFESLKLLLAMFRNKQTLEHKQNHTTTFLQSYTNHSQQSTYNTGQ